MIGAVVGAVPTFLTTSVYMPGRPTVKSPLWRFNIVRSGALTTVRSDAESLAAFGSPGVATDAVLVTLGDAAAATLTVRSKVRLSPDTIGPLCVAVTVPLAEAKLQPAPAPETKLRPAGSGSVTVIPPPVGPLPTLVTTSV